MTSVFALIDLPSFKLFAWGINSCLHNILCTSHRATLVFLEYKTLTAVQALHTCGFSTYMKLILSFYFVLGIGKFRLFFRCHILHFDQVAWGRWSIFKIPTRTSKIYFYSVLYFMYCVCHIFSTMAFCLSLVACLCSAFFKCHNTAQISLYLLHVFMFIYIF